MHIIVVDDEKFALVSAVKSVSEAAPEAEVKAFRKAAEAFDYAAEHQVDVAFLDIQMREMSGIELSGRLLKLNPKMNIIFITGYSEYALDAVKMRCSGYLVKPVTQQQVALELANLRIPVDENERSISIRTFGNFEVYVDGLPVKFKRSRSKEVLAYLVDRRGTGAAMSELAAVIYEDREYNRSLQNQMQVFVSDLMNDLKAAGAERLVIREHNSLSVDTGAAQCDYYDLLEHKPLACGAYFGEYMVNYSWAEETNGRLMEKYEKI